MSTRPVDEPPSPGPLPITRTAAGRLAAIRAAGVLLYAAILFYAPGEVTRATPPDAFIALATAVGLLTAVPRLWTNAGTRITLVAGDLVVMVVVVALVGDRLLLGALVTTVVVADAGLPRRWHRFGLVLGPILVGTMAVVRVDWRAGLWTGLFTSAVLSLVTRARQDADRRRQDAVRRSAALNRVQLDLASSIDGMAWRAERARPAGHDIAAVISGMHAMATRVQRATGDRHLATELLRLREAYDRLADGLARAADLARRRLQATVLIASADDRDRVISSARRLGGLPYRYVIVGTRVIVYVTFGTYVLAATSGNRVPALAVTATGLVMALVMIATDRPGPNFAVHLHDGVAIAVAVATIGGMTGPIAPVVVGQAAMTAINLDRARHRHLALSVTAIGLLITGATSAAGPAWSHLLIAAWWVVTLTWGHVWFRQIHVQAEAHESWARQAESNRRITASEARDALRLASEVDATFEDFTITAREVAQNCLDRSAGLADEGSPVGRAASVLRDEATHLLELVDELVVQTSDEIEPLTPRSTPPAQVVAPAIAASMASGAVVLVDRSDGAEVITSRHHVERIVRNLVSNAVRYRRARPVEVTVRRDDARWSIDVTDDGPGLNPTEFVRLCRKYTQGGEDDQTGQLGLGLWIASRNAQALGGSLDSHRTRRGFTVTVDLPVVPPPVAATPAVTVHDEQASPSPGA